MRPLLALRAGMRMVKSRGADKRHAILFIRALEGRSSRRAFERFRQTSMGQQLLQHRPSLIAALAAIEGGAGNPPAGSLADAYRAFLRRQGFQATGAMEVAQSPLDQVLPDDEAYVEDRARAMHDLWHVVTGYEGDAFGEVCLVAFRAAQVPHLAFAILTLVMLIKPPFPAPGAPARRAILEAWRLGKQAAWLRAAPWEDLLPQDLEAVRRRLRLQPPTVYNTVVAINAGHGPREPAALAPSAIATPVR